MSQSAAEDARQIFQATVAACRADRIIARTCALHDDVLDAGGQVIDLAPFERTRLCGAGKASVEMCAGLADVLDAPLARGLAVTKHWDRSFNPPVEIIGAGHPEPNEQSLIAGEAMLNLAREMTERDLVIFSLSGGASALMESPLAPITIDGLIKTNQVLLGSGLPIREVNAIRKRISNIKNGGLARAFHPATVVCFVLSDVIGNDFYSIGSSPLLSQDVPALANLPQGLPDSILKVLARAAPTPPTPAVKHVVLADAHYAAQRAGEIACHLGYTIQIDEIAFEGEASDLGRSWAARTQDLPPRTVHIGYGESTVTLGDSRSLGGRAQEAALASALDIAGIPDIAVLVAGTDGVDGPTDSAGAVVDGESTQRAGLNAAKSLATHDSYRFHEAAGTHIKTGHTGTNLNELAILIRN